MEAKMIELPQLMQKLKQNETVVSIIGLGYIGFPLAQSSV